MRKVTRILEIDAGHRLMNHEGKCRNVHGHRYKFEITVAADSLDDVGRVLDFGVIKEKVGGWLDAEWDHGFIVQIGDPLLAALKEDKSKYYIMAAPPTAENMSTLLAEVAATLLSPHGIRVARVRCWETPNCYADARGNI